MRVRLLNEKRPLPLISGNGLSSFRLNLRAASRLRPGRNGPLRVRTPFAPRPRVERRAMQAGHFHRERIDARRHPGAALQDDVFWRRVAEQHVELVAQRVSRLEAAVGGEVVLEEAIERAGNMAAY